VCDANKTKRNVEKKNLSECSQQWHT